MKLSKKELKEIKAGTSITGTLINSLIKGFDSILDVGRYFGSSIRRLVTGNSCTF